MTIAKRILAAHAGKESVETGEFVNVKVDLIMAHDLTAGIALQEFSKIGCKKVFDPKKVVLVMDHYVRGRGQRRDRQNQPPQGGDGAGSKYGGRFNVCDVN